MHICTIPVVPSDLFDRLDDDWHDYASFSGVATRYHVIGPIDGSAYYVVPDYMGPRGRQSVTCHVYKVSADITGDGLTRRRREAQSYAAARAAEGIASALAMRQVLAEIAD